MRIGFGPVSPTLTSLEGSLLRERVLASRRFWLRELRGVARHVWLFGSVARNEATKTSDIDLLIESQADDRELESIAARLAVLVGRSVHLIRSEALHRSAVLDFDKRFQTDAIPLRRSSGSP